ncbi:MAG TPA: LLM class flavin-dependent oxidoreductase [Acidimicrobiia bacterium]|nr:LLM class flavin-dependent oxidoreductase [Acidimicrobiia bacterium]
MALKDTIAFGMSLPHRSAEPIPAAVVAHVARRAEQLGFRDLWVTNNTVDEAGCFDSLTLLTYAAALTNTIRLGVSVLVLPTYHPVHVAHQVATLDQLSAGRAILGVGLGRAEDYEVFEVPTERRITRFTESVELIKALWAGPRASYQGEIYQAHDITLGVRPRQRPHPPMWVGGHHPAAIARAAAMSDGWMGAGASSRESLATAVPLLHTALEAAGRDPATFPISKRVFISVHDRREVARAEVDRWFGGVCRNPAGADQFGVFGTPEHVGEQLEALVATGATHLLLNPVTRFAEQLEALAEIIGLRGSRSTSSRHSLRS